jgi:hypothetical protein
VDFCKKPDRSCIALSKKAGAFIDNHKITSLGGDEIIFEYSSEKSVCLEAENTLLT